MSLSGSICAIATPFRSRDDAIDFAAFERLVDHQVDNGTRALVVAGSTGEAAALDEAEFETLLQTAVRRVAGRDMITITNTFVDQHGENVHTMHTTVVGVTAEDVDPGINDAVKKVMMHDVDFDSFEAASADYVKTVRPDGPQRIATAGATRVPGSLSFDELAVGDHHRHADLGVEVGDAGERDLLMVG